MSGRRQPEGSLSGRSSDDTSSTNSVGGKMILPRLDGPLYEVNAIPKRTAHACERCRTLKAKCTGGERCEKCIVDKAECRYGDGKRERNKKELASQLQKSTSLIKHNGDLLAALREVSADPNFDAQKHPAVMLLLSNGGAFPSTHDRMAGPLSTTHYPGEDVPKKIAIRGDANRAREMTSNSEGEGAIGASVGSPGAIDQMAPLVSLGIGSGASGYVGKSSEISWLQRAQEQMSLQQSNDDQFWPEQDEENPDGSHLDYHMDEANLLAVDEDSVDPMEVPPLPIARVLADSYFETIHGTFPLVDQEEFMEVLVSQFHNRQPLSWKGRRWLSVANIIFAVGAKWLYLTRPRRGDMQGPNIGPGDHIVYYARARSLGLDHRLIMDHPLIEQIQALGILGLYLIVNHQISRAWTTVGHAVRHAVALGLHLRVGAGIDVNQQQSRSRTWWSLYALEQLLGDFTGRPTSILDTDIATPLDLPPMSEFTLRSARPISAHQPPQDRSPPRPRDLQYPPHLYFVWRSRLSVIGHKIRSSLYASGRMDEPWSRIQESIRHSDQELTRWSANLPKEMSLPEVKDFDFEQHDAQLLNHFELALAHQSTRMILFRPCLCHLEGVIPHESALSQNFNQEAALSCVSAARTLLALLPGKAANSHASKMLPWWSLLHYITQAGAVLILELCLKAEHMPSQVKQLWEDVGKVMAWLAEMATDSLSAWRSWKIFRKLSLQAAGVVGLDVVIPEDVQKPQGWNATYEQRISQTLHVTSDQQPTMELLRHLHQAGIPRFTTSDAPFPGNGEISGGSWQALSNMPGSTANLAFDGEHPILRSTDDPAAKMDWTA